MENLDMKEMIYTQTQKDVAETKIHHLLSENLFMPKNRVSCLLREMQNCNWETIYYGMLYYKFLLIVEMYL